MTSKPATTMFIDYTNAQEFSQDIITRLQTMRTIIATQPSHTLDTHLVLTHLNAITSHMTNLPTYTNHINQTHDADLTNPESQLLATIMKLTIECIILRLQLAERILQTTSK